MITQTDNITKDDLAAYIGRNKLKYLYKFSKFEIRQDRFALTWHWSAFCFGPLWFLYRKLYFWGLLTMVISFLPVGNFIAQFAYGICAYYIYYLDCKKKIATIKAENPMHCANQAIKEAGGVHRWILWVSLIIAFLTPLVGLYFHDNIFDQIKTYHYEIKIQNNEPIKGQEI